MQRVGDVARAAAELATHGGHEEAHVEDVYLFRQDVFPEPALEGHDVVVGERAADQRSQGVNSPN
jgi:hypothetical protein